MGSNWTTEASSSSLSFSSHILSSSISMDYPIYSLVIIIPSSNGSSFKMKTNTQYFEVDSIAGNILIIQFPSQFVLPGFVTVSSPLYSINSTEVSLELLKILPPPSIEPIKITLNIHIE